MKLIQLFLSAMISSWQFFKEADTAVTIEYKAFFNDEESVEWQELVLRPVERNFLEICSSLFYNYKWNEALFIMDIAEKLTQDFDEQDYLELVDRIRRRLVLIKFYSPRSYFKFQLSIDNQSSKEVVFISSKEKLKGETSEF